jgi:hypothetical protein
MAIVLTIFKWCNAYSSHNVPRCNGYSSHKLS